LPTERIHMASFRVARLRCEYGTDPLGIDVPAPRLSWILESEIRGVAQSAYRVLVASRKDILAKNMGDLWDTGTVYSSETLHIPYSGNDLVSSQEVFWKVRSWNLNGVASAWSDEASWTMGIMKQAHWRASWIGAAGNPQSLLLRKEFSVRSGLRRALVHACGLGHYEMRLNGGKVGDDLFPPGWTKYDKTCLYDTHDITAQLRKGTNAIAFVLAGGMYSVRGGRYTKFKNSFGSLVVIAHIRLEYADGSIDIFGTDNSWCTGESPVTFSCVYGGEDHDARLEKPGWDMPEFNDRAWEQAVVLSGPGGVLRGFTFSAPPVRVIERRLPLVVKRISKRISVYDMGQNTSFMPRIIVRGARGSVVKIIPAERIGNNGRVDRSSSGGKNAYWKYTLGGGSDEEWFPKFFYHGSRYFQVEVKPASYAGELPAILFFDGVVVHSSAEPIGEFECSSELFNRIRALIRWAQRSNLAHVITDCPHRERLGWLEQYHLNGPSLNYEFDLARMFTKSMNDMADSQLDNGLVPDIAPEYVKFSGGFRDSPEWGAAHVLVPAQQYVWVGDTLLFRRHYESMKRYVEYLSAKSENFLLFHGLGDWYDTGPHFPGLTRLTSPAVTATAFYYLSAVKLAEAARLLENRTDAERFEALAENIRAAFNREFFVPDGGYYATNSQTANAIAVATGLVEANDKMCVLENIVRDIRKRGNTLSSGDIGHRYLLRALAENGRSDVIFDMNNQSDMPGYGYQLARGATALCESWDANRRSSNNHFMLGHIMEWFYRDVAGIAPDPKFPGFRRVLIKPHAVDELSWARASYNSVRGKILSAWQKEDGSFRMSITIPPNAAALVYIPAPLEAITESGVPVTDAEGVAYEGVSGEYSIFEVLSGSYAFEAKLR